MKHIKLIGIFIGTWILFSLIMFLFVELSILLQPYTELGKILTRWVSQIMAFFVALFATLSYKN